MGRNEEEVAANDSNTNDQASGGDALQAGEPQPVSGSPFSAPNQTPLRWVGIGASAGGLEALRGFVRSLSPALPATYIVAQHMAPHHRSMLVEIISRETDIPVRDVADGITPEANTIYITPPNANLTVEGDVLRLTEPDKSLAAPKPSVDVFFTSLAESKGTDAIGIVLSGTGSDSSEGVRALREHGGITIAQDEATAKYSSMPSSALETGCIDLVMSPEQMGLQFGKVVDEPRDLDSLRSSPIDLDSVSELVRLLLEQTKVNFRHYKTATFQRRVERRMAAIDVTSLDAYVAVARYSPSEIDSLFKDLLISVTSFFRDPSEFETIGPYIEQIVEKKDGSPIRIWVAGTATGEEAYSLAIMFAEAFGGLVEFERARIQIFATDLDEHAIAVARQGHYPESSLQEVPQSFIDQYFDVVPGGYRVKKSLREKVVFSTHNIAADPPFLNIDLLSCRNLLIYFQAVLQAHVFARFHYSLVPHGVLFLGKSETVAAAPSLFRLAGDEKHIFLQRPAASRSPLSDTLSPSTNLALARTTRRNEQVLYPPPEARELAIAEARFESLVRGLGPNGMLLSSELNVLRVFGDVRDYVGLSEGPVSTNADSLLREPFRRDVRVLVPSAIRQKAVMEGVARTVIDNPNERERITAYPIGNGPEDETLALIVFSRWTEDLIVGDGEDFDSASTETIERMRRELAISQTNLQHTIEELETSNEELQALNEELQSSNEELQSTNEELETSNEELQSTNEELSTVNEELQVNGMQLNAANQSLQSILDNVAVPMIVVDRQMNITHTSAASTQLFGISPDLVLPHLSRCRVPQGFPSLTDAVDRALETRARVDLEVSTVAISAHVSVVPNFETNGEMVGAIVLVSDSTFALQQSNAQLNAAVGLAGVGYVTRDLIKNEARWSEHMYEMLGATNEFSFVPSEENDWGLSLLSANSRVEMRAALKKLEEDELPFDIDVDVIDVRGMHKSIRLNVTPGFDNNNELVGWLAVAIDITEQADREAKLQATLRELSRSNEELNRFSYVCSHDMKEPVRMIESLAELLLDDDVQTSDEQGQAILQRISSNMTRLRRTIDSLLAYSRIDAKVEESTIDLRDVVIEMDDSLSLMITEQDADIIIGELPNVVGARIHFAQLFQNLIGNALKFSDKDQPIVKISSAQDEHNVYLFIEDNGPGIPEEHRTKVFNLFDRLHRQDEVEGVGLGLSICQRIVSQYGGQIACGDSELGGAQFKITIPIPEQPAVL